MVVFALFFALATPAPPAPAGDVSPDGQRCWTGTAWDWCTTPPSLPLPTPPTAPTLTPTTGAPATTATPTTPGTFSVLTFDFAGLPEALALAARDAVNAEWRAMNPAATAVPPALAAAGPCLIISCGRLDQPAIDVVVAGRVFRDADGIHVQIDLGDAWGVNVSAARVVGVVGSDGGSPVDIAAAAVAALREASAKLAAPPTSPKPRPPW